MLLTSSSPKAELQYQKYYLHRDLSSVMVNGDLSEAEKAQLYGQTLHKFKTAHQKALKETSLFPPCDPSSFKMNQLVIDSVPSL